MTILIDSYDSFSYNLYQLVGELDPTVKVIRNDEMTVEELEALHPDRIILSPGPGRPEDGEVMGVKHRDYPIYGVQFHPESILTPRGKDMLKNFIALSKEGAQA